MAGGLPDYLIGDKGVQLTGSPIHTPDSGLLVGQNVEFVREQGLGGIGSRRSLTALNTTALAGAVKHVANLPFPYPTALIMMVGLNSAEDPLSWLTTVDGTTFETVAVTVAKRSLDVGYFTANVSAFLHGLNVYMPQKAASYRRRFYYASDDYVVWYSGIAADTATRPVVAQYDGSIGLELFRLPDNPTATVGSLPFWIIRLDVIAGLIWLCVFDPGGVAPNLKGRVLTFDPEDGTMALVGNRFGDGTGENTGGMPYCLRSYAGRIFCGTMGISGNPAGKVYSILAGVETEWALDRAMAADDGYCMDLLEYNGDLYLSTACDASGTARVDKRTGAGVWSASFTAPTTNVAYCGPLVEFEDELYTCFFAGSGGTKYCLIKKFDGSSWTTDKDINTDYSVTTLVPGQPYVFRDALYWPFFPGATTDTSGFLLKRTAAGAWSKVLDARGIRGCLGAYRDSATDEPGPSPPTPSGPFSSGFSSGFGV